MTDTLNERAFPDERFTVLEHSGNVDCLVCGHKVNVLKAYRVEHTAGPDGFLHEACVQSFLDRVAGPAVAGHRANVAYHDAVAAAVKNLQ